MGHTITVYAQPAFDWAPLALCLSLLLLQMLFFFATHIIEYWKSHFLGMRQDEVGFSISRC